MHGVRRGGRIINIGGTAGDLSVDEIHIFESGHPDGLAQLKSSRAGGTCGSGPFSREARFRLPGRERFAAAVRMPYRIHRVTQVCWSAGTSSNQRTTPLAACAARKRMQRRRERPRRGGARRPR